MPGIYGSGNSSAYTLNPYSVRQTGSPAVAPVGYAPEVIRLAGQITRQRAKAGIGVPKAPDPGLLGRIFDVVQRPLYTTANTVQFLQGGDTGADNPMEAAWRGFSGQDKTTYDNVLEEAGMAGGWQRALASFGMDVALDPSSYVGIGVVKGAAEGVTKKLATETALKAVGSKAAKKEILDSTERIIAQNTVKIGGETGASKAARRKSAGEMAKLSDEELIAAAQSGSGLPDKGYMGFRQKVSRKEATDLAKAEWRGNKAAEIMEAADKGIAENRGKVVLRILGRETPVASRGLYKAGSKTAQYLGKLEPLQVINRAFRPLAHFPQGTNDLLRDSMGHTVFDTEEAIKQIKRYFGNKTFKFADGETWGGLDKSHRKMISKAIENKEDLSQIVIDSTGRTLQEYKEQAETIFSHLHQAESGLGMRNAEDAIPNYMHHAFKGGSKADQDAWKTGRKKVIEKYRTAKEEAEKKGGVLTIDDPTPGFKLEDAAAAGLDPEMDIMHILAKRATKSFQGQAPARWWSAVMLEHGIHLDEHMKGLGAGKAKQMAKELNLEKVSSPFGDSAWFHPEVAAALKKSREIFHPNSGPGKELARLFDKVQNYWKLEMTALNPGHHIRNFMGDVYLNFLDGVVNPLRYLQSAKVLRNWEKAPGAIKIRVGNRILDGEQIMTLFTQRGGKAGFWRDELIESGVKPIEMIRQVAEKREDWTRMAHFIDALKKEGRGVTTGKEGLEQIGQAARRAGKRVRKWNIDYGDLTPFEKTVMKRIVPFYTWMRKNIPLQIETLFMNPGKVAFIPKALRGVAGVAGNLEDDEMFGLNMTPKWIREMAGVRVAGEGQGRNATYWNPSVIPFSDIQQYFGGGKEEILRSWLGVLSPAARGPIELGTGVSLMTGGPVSDTGMGYGQQNLLPPTATRVWQMMKNEADRTDYAALLGISLYDVGPQQQLGELRRQQDPIQTLLSMRNKKPRSWEVAGG